MTEPIRSRRDMHKRIGLGPTGNHPRGKLHDGDQGEIRFAVAAVHGNVIMDFGKVPITWIGLRPQEAEQVVEALKEAIRRCKT